VHACGLQRTGIMMLQVKVIELSQRLENTMLNASYGLSSAGRTQKYVHWSISVDKSRDYPLSIYN